MSYQQGFAVVRIDYPIADDIQLSVKVKSVHMTEEIAKAEAKRLNDLQGRFVATSKSYYFYQHTHVYHE